jgi:hypothetical protein
MRKSRKPLAQAPIINNHRTKDKEGMKIVPIGSFVLVWLLVYAIQLFAPYGVRKGRLTAGDYSSCHRSSLEGNLVTLMYILAGDEPSGNKAPRLSNASWYTFYEL